MKRKLVKLPPVYEKIEERVTACTQPEGLTVTLSGDVAMIGYSKVSEYYRGLSILAKWQEEGRIAGHCDGGLLPERGVQCGLPEKAINLDGVYGI